MREYLTLGPTPCEEECAQLGITEGFDTVARAECRRYMDQLRRQFGPEPEGARLAIKSFPHDYGNYYEVVCHYDDAYPAAIEYAFAIENNLPGNWEG